MNTKSSQIVIKTWVLITIQVGYVFIYINQSSEWKHDWYTWLSWTKFKYTHFLSWHSLFQTLALHSSFQALKKKYLWFPVSYHEKIRVGRSEIIFFWNIFFMVFSIISVTTDAILAAARNHPEKIGSHSQSLWKNNRVGRKK
jgi:hypothetical protein